MDVAKAGNRERGTGNGEQGMGNGERGTGNQQGEREDENWEQNEVADRARFQVRFCFQFFIFPFPMLVPRSPFPVPRSTFHVPRLSNTLQYALDEKMDSLATESGLES